MADRATHVYHQYTIRVEATERDRIVAELREKHAVGCGVYYPIPNHRLDVTGPASPATWTCPRPNAPRPR